MELCDVNLADYTKSSYDRTKLLPTEELRNGKKPVVILHTSTFGDYHANVDTIMHHIVSALEFLHQQGYAHRDLKPKNGNSG
jgi:serine/threonine protein kinase